MTPLPIHDILPELLQALEVAPNAVLVAPPGAGKTTGVPLALLHAPWRQDGKILVLSPRRLAARAAAQRMADLLGEKPGETVGYRVRLDTKVSGKTRIEVVTEGVFTRLIMDQPDLPGIAAVLFDEFHERSLDADLGLALALEAQTALRNDLRLLPMSATLDGARIAKLMGDCPVIESQGRMFPVETRYLGWHPAERLEDQAAKAIRQALAQDSGSLLVFLPGAAEIERTAERLSPPAGVRVHKLYGALDIADQRRAIEPAKPGERKIVLATSIAETSLTIEGVRVVIDCGLARRPKYDPGPGLTRLVTEKASQAAVEQRRGRAGRLEPGVCYRLWDEPQTRVLPAYDPPEIMQADLSGLALDLAKWGAADAAALAWLDPPPKAAFAEARTLLSDLDALDAAGRITAHGRALSALPLPPRLAHMILAASAKGAGPLACEIAAVLGERSLGGNDVDIAHRIDRFRQDRSARASQVRGMAQGWARLVPCNWELVPTSNAGWVLALAYPDRIARNRGGEGTFLLANGRGGRVEAHDLLAKAPYLAVADMTGTAEKARIVAAAAIDEADVRDHLGDMLKTESLVRWEPRVGVAQPVTQTRLGRLVLSEKPWAKAPPEALAQALLTGLRQAGLPWSAAQSALRERINWLRAQGAPDWPDLSDAAVLQALEPHLAGLTRLSQVTGQVLGEALESMIAWALKQRLATEAPDRFETPLGTSHAIDYAAPAGPTVSLRVQELFGLATHPTIAGGRVPLVLELLSPAHRPIQTTRDLPGFWAGSWAAVKAEMKGRYPKHPWPDDPANAKPTTRTKAADARRAGQ
jgi:ATP-dependent helicase HrpB